MEVYKFIIEQGEIKLVTNGESHKIGKAFIKGQNIIYIHPTKSEIAMGTGVIRYVLTDEDIDTIQELLNES